MTHYYFGICGVYEKEGPESSGRKGKTRSFTPH